MAEKRMFAKSIIDSDAFLEMPTTSQLLYFHLSMRADDDGFINKPKSIMRMIGCKDDDINILFARKFVIPFDSGVVVIKHWRINNYIRQDTYHETNYKDEKAMLRIDENNAYTLSVTNPLQICNETETQIRLDKTRLDKTSKDNIKHRYGKYDNVMLTDKELETLKNEFEDWQERIERVSEYCASKGKAYKNYLATIRNWARKEQPKKQDDLPVYDASHNIDVDLERLKDIRGETL